jgi:type I restriction enzyme S subunit
MTELPSGWAIKRLEDLCEPGRQAIVDGPFGSNLKRSDYVESGIPVLKIQNIKENVITLKKMDYVKPEKYEELARHSFTQGDIVMTKLGDPLGVSAIVDGIPDGLIVADLVRIRPSKVLTKFLCYQLNSPRIQNYINEQQKGTTRPRVNLAMIRELPIYTAPIEEQHKIVERLEDHLLRLDAALVDLRQAKIKAAQFRRSILQAAFSGNLFAHVTSSGTSLPKDWEHLSIGSLCESVTKIDPINLGRDSFKYVDIGSLEPSSSSLENVVAIPTKDAPGRARQLLAVGDSIFATVRPYMKKVAYISQDFDGEIASTGFCVLRPNQEKLHARYLFYFLLSDNLLDQVLPLQRGVSYPAIRDNDLRIASIALPPISDQQRIVTILEDHFSQLEPIVRMADIMEMQAAALRRSLLQSAFTGQLTKEVANV